MSDLPNPADLDALAAPPADDTDTAPVQTTPADLPGALKSWLGNVGGRLQGWAQDAATIVNDFVTRRDIADKATLDAQAFTNNVREFSRGLDTVVRADPTATNMALGLAAITVPAIVADHPYLPDDQKAQVADQLAGEVGKSVAQNAVVAWAQRDPDSAHAELKRLGGLFPDNEREALADHVDLIGTAKDMDANAAQIQEANRRADASFERSKLYGDELIRPGGPAPDFVRRVVNDQTVNPQDTDQLMRRQQAMMDQASSGVPPKTNGLQFDKFLDMAGAGRQGWNQLWDQTMNGNLNPATAQALAKASPGDLAAMSKFYQNARRAAVGADGDLLNPHTSDALGKQMEQMVQAYSRWGVGSLDPNDPNFFGAMHKGFGQTALDQRLATEQKAAKLEDIFARRQEMRVARENAMAARRAQEFGIRQELETVNRERVKNERDAARAEATRQRDERLNVRNMERQQRAANVAAATQAKLEQQNEARQIAQADRIASAGPRGPAQRPPPNPAETFRKWVGLGRTPRV